MKNILVFSDKPKPLRLYIKLQFTKLGRRFRIVFKRRTRLEILSLDYYKNWHFDNAYLVIDFKFNNAVWFKIDNNIGIDFKKPFILNLQNIKSNTINFEVYGLFQKKVFKIKLNKDAQINTGLLKTRIMSINTIEISPPKTRVGLPGFGLVVKEPSFNLGKITVIEKTIEVKHTHFKTQEHL